MYTDIQSKRLLFFPDFNEILIFRADYQKIKFEENYSIGRPKFFHADGQSCERALKIVLYTLGLKIF
jgi:hypothetical protein